MRKWILCIGLVLVLASMTLLLICQRTVISFDPKRWKENHSFERESMVGELIESNQLLGKNGSYILSLLGEPSFRSDLRWDYEIPPRDDSFKTLTLHFENNHVKSVEVKSNP